MRINREIILAGVVLGTAVGQIPPTRLEFEVASVKSAEGLVAGRAATGGMRVDGAQVHWDGSLLKSLIALAYNLKLYQVIGPDWLDLRFHIDAKLPAGTDRRQIPEMVQSLLADRFQMKFHNQSKEFLVYALVAASGTKLLDQGSPEEPPNPNGASETAGYGGPGGMGARSSDGSFYSLENNKFEGRKLTMGRMASILSACLDRPVVDMTELHGRYDLSFPITEEDLHGMIRRGFVNGGGSVSPEALRDLDSMDLASLHAGLNSFGLKLEGRKSPLPVLVVDSILKSPTEN